MFDPRVYLPLEHPWRLGQCTDPPVESRDDFIDEVIRQRQILYFHDLPRRDINVEGFEDIRWNEPLSSQETFDKWLKYLDAVHIDNWILDDLSCKGRKIKGPFSANGTRFFGRVSFRRTCFRGSASFNGAIFYKEANFQHIEFHDWVWFYGTKFHKEVFFNYTKPEKALRFTNLCLFEDTVLYFQDILASKSGAICFEHNIWAKGQIVLKKFMRDNPDEENFWYKGEYRKHDDYRLLFADCCLLSRNVTISGISLGQVDLQGESLVEYNLQNVRSTLKKSRDKDLTLNTIYEDEFQDGVQNQLYNKKGRDTFIQNQINRYIVLKQYAKDINDVHLESDLHYCQMYWQGKQIANPININKLYYWFSGYGLSWVRPLRTYVYCFLISGIVYFLIYLFGYYNLVSCIRLMIHFSQGHICLLSDSSESFRLLIESFWLSFGASGFLLNPLSLLDRDKYFMLFTSAIVGIFFFQKVIQTSLLIQIGLAIRNRVRR